MPRSKQGLARLVARTTSSPSVVEAFARVDRADFVPAEARSLAYQDRPVGIPAEQTTSQPSLIAHMIEAAGPDPVGRVLEIGTGYGFQTALLAQLFARVVSVERHRELCRIATANLERAGIDRVEVHHGDGWRGWPPSAPYDAIVVSASADGLPVELGEQLSEGGRLVVPLKQPSSDEVTVFEKRESALHKLFVLTPARFVPLVKEDRG